MDAKCENKSGVKICCITGEINIDTVAALRGVFKEILDEREEKVLLNLEHTEYIDSLGLATLLAFYKGIKAYGGRLVLSNIIPKVGTIFKITKVDKVLEIFDEENDAIRSLQ